MSKYQEYKAKAKILDQMADFLTGDAVVNTFRLVSEYNGQSVELTIDRALDEIQVTATNTHSEQS